MDQAPFVLQKESRKRGRPPQNLLPRTSGASACPIMAGGAWASHLSPVPQFPHLGIRLSRVGVLEPREPIEACPLPTPPPPTQAPRAPPPPPTVLVFLVSNPHPPEGVPLGTDGCQLIHCFLLGLSPSLMLSGDFPGLPRTPEIRWGKRGQREHPANPQPEPGAPGVVNAVGPYVCVHAGARGSVSVEV